MTTDWENAVVIDPRELRRLEDENGKLNRRSRFQTLGLVIAAVALSATAGALVALILTFGPISGAHFNPAVTLAFAVRKALPWKAVPGYLLAQLVGAVLGVWLAHVMFGLPVVQASAHAQTGLGGCPGFSASFRVFCGSK